MSKMFKMWQHCQDSRSVKKKPQTKATNLVLITDVDALHCDLYVLDDLGDQLLHERVVFLLLQRLLGCRPDDSLLVIIIITGTGMEHKQKALGKAAAFMNQSTTAETFVVDCCVRPSLLLLK